jgi:hypothetical protein
LSFALNLFIHDIYHEQKIVNSPRRRVSQPGNHKGKGAIHSLVVGGVSIDAATGFGAVFPTIDAGFAAVTLPQGLSADFLAQAWLREYIQEHAAQQGVRVSWNKRRQLRPND